MAKRFTDSEKWEDVWYCNLPMKYKMFWIYVLDKCDNAGFWTPNWAVTKAYVGEDFEQTEVKRFVGNKAIILDSGKWFIPSFIKFQYPRGLKHTSAPQKSVIDKLLKYNQLEYVFKSFPKGYLTLKEGLQDKDIEMGMDKEIDRSKEIDKRDFEPFNLSEQNEEPNNPKLSQLQKAEFVELFTPLWMSHPQGNPKRCKEVLKNLTLLEYQSLLEFIPGYLKGNNFTMNLENLIESEKWMPAYAKVEVGLPEGYKGTEEVYLKKVEQGFSWSPERSFYKPKVA